MLCAHGLESAVGDLFLKDKVGNTAAGGGIAIKSYAYGVDGIDGTSEIGFIPRSMLLNQGTVEYACIKVGIAQHLTDVAWNTNIIFSLMKTDKNGMLIIVFINLDKLQIWHQLWMI